MEIIVQVLPLMMIKEAEISKMKQNFINNFSKMFKDFLKTKYLIQMYNCQQKKHKKNLTQEIEKQFQQNVLVIQVKQEQSVILEKQEELQVETGGNQEQKYKRRYLFKKRYKLLKQILRLLRLEIKWKRSQFHFTLKSLKNSMD
ncbi:unnamed protein product [Paramecium sonneborni]|uniref:Uncharacterized protein n=1 Tax=Paramecium sonneborni TaxID=65129 RepID=A0A8S1RT35_9CILI|nr:unnamed protein product [Paramecium sonneborni]